MFHPVGDMKTSMSRAARYASESYGHLHKHRGPVLPVLTFSQLTRNICHRKDWISRAPAERKRGITASSPARRYDRALHISWLISKTLTSPRCWFPLWRGKAVILFTKASATRSPLCLAPLGHLSA